jgi:putative DNA primase/helicase
VLQASGVEEVVVVPDNDDAGRRYALQAGTALTARGITVRVLELASVPEKGDVSDWLHAGGTVEALKSLVEQAPAFDDWRNTSDVRRVVDLRHGDWRQILEEAYSAVVRTNRRHGGPWVFVGPENLVRVVRRLSDRPTALQVDTDDTLRGYLMRNVTFLAGSERSPKSVVPPSTVLRDILTRPTWPGLPELRGVIATPVLSRDGEVVTTPGYQHQTQLWYSPAPDFEIPPVPERPTVSDVTAATDLLAELMCDFPFDGPGSRANAVALMLLPFVRESIKGPTPLHLIDATTPGAGKGLLADCCSVVATGREAGKGPEPRDPDETRKFITSALVAGASMIVLDNVGHLDSAPLARVLTTEIWEDRLLGYSRQVRPLNRAVWVATGNNVTLSRELARRALWIRMEPEQERPELRSGFRHPDLLRWVREQRGALVAACLTVARAWVVEGRPSGSEVLGRMFGSYESWLDVIGGVLVVAGVEGLLDNQDKLADQGDDELGPWKAFIHLWREASERDAVAPVTGGRQAQQGFHFHVPREANVHQLLDIAEKAGLDIGDMGDASRMRKLGRALSRIEGRVIGSARIKSRSLNGRKLYRIE